MVNVFNREIAVEGFLVLFLLVALLFLAVNFEPIISLTFSIFILFGVVARYFDKKVSFQIEANPNKRYINIAIGVAATFAFYIVASFLLPFLSSVFKFPLDGGGMSVVQSMFASNVLFSQYALAGLALVTFLVWCIIIPLSENFFNTRLYEFLLDKFNLDIGFKWSKLFPIITIASIMSIFHISAKGASIEATGALFVTLLFFAFVLIITELTGDMIAGFTMHIVANTLALKSLVPNLIPTSPYVLGIIGVVVLILILRTKIVEEVFSRF